MPCAFTIDREQRNRCSLTATGAEHHALRLHAADGSRLQIGHDNYFEPNQFRGSVIGGKSSHEGALFLAEIDLHLEQPLSARNRLSRTDLGNTQIETFEVLNGHHGRLLEAILFDTYKSVEASRQKKSAMLRARNRRVVPRPAPG